MTILYLFMFLSLWTLGLTFLAFNFRRNFWIALTMLCGGMSSCAFSIHLTILPRIQPLGWLTPEAEAFLYQTSVFMMTVYLYLFPAITSLGALWMGGVESRRLRLLIASALLLPAVLNLLRHLEQDPWNVFVFEEQRLLVGFHLAVAVFFFFFAYWRDGSMYSLNNKKRVAWLFSIAVVWAYVTDFLGMKRLELRMWEFRLESNNLWQLNVIMIFSLVGAILYQLIRNGFLGIKLRIERDRRSYSMRTITMGVSILNHSIKNEIQKIDYLIEKASGMLKEGDKESSLHSLRQIGGVTSHLLSMVESIREKSDDIVLRESAVEVREILENALGPMRSQLAARGTRLEASIEDGKLTGDRMHLQETVSNLLHNAAEAVAGKEGIISVRAFSTRKRFIIEVRDNGAGIDPEHAARILEPFYSTKKNASNHGLGLSYCAQVVQKHGGSIVFPPVEPGSGAIVQLQLAASRFKAHPPPSPAVEPLRQPSSSSASREGG
ncbi:HAMP domain-containing histidine kinase [Paenibacillus albicereus]|uniref:histidine kinase n=1 Tax=Paenibacillus albicereus TaxID=2726185 RepID=A0A6H2GWF5_9BACL|nr:HAMP domain-containing sensor histidine kinase [Paenibacillus albicereus]QJC51722.1 HAMP domain-containing histidine kinase [Paenibacillus albicereus]